MKSSAGISGAISLKLGAFELLVVMPAELTALCLRSSVTGSAAVVGTLFLSLKLEG